MKGLLVQFLNDVLPDVWTSYKLVMQDFADKRDCTIDALGDKHLCFVTCLEPTPNLEEEASRSKGFRC